VGIARAIVANPTVVVADEPTGNLDANTGQQIQELLTRLNTELGMTILMVTHDVKMAQIATRQLRLENGKIEEEDCKVKIEKCKLQIDDLPCRPS
jgi:putative ABC transport system ATP-binding protein